MSSGYMPSKDGDFSAWAMQFLNYVSAHEAELKVTAAEVAALGTLQTGWGAAYAAHVLAQTTARSCTVEKDDQRKAFAGGIRPIVGRILADPEVTDAMREEMGLKPRHSAASSTGIEIVDERPMLLIDISARLKHVIRMQTETPSGVKKAKPQGVFGYELFRKIGDGPAPIEQMESLGLVTRSPKIMEYTAEEAGKTASYALRWVNSNGEYGAWSEVRTATIAA